MILPYWNRQEAARAALKLLKQHYYALDLEVVVIDDGSAEPFVAPHFTPWELTVVRLPAKTEAKSTCVPWNRGVAAASGDVIALSGVEMLHVNPVLDQMREELLKGDKNTYVSASVWCPDQNRWHVHSSLNRAPLNFMTMLHRDLWDRAGGFDEDYRDGMAFDDADFLFRLDRAGARFVIRDDLVVEHPRKGAKANYTKEQHDRNRLMFARKWSGQDQHQQG